MPCEHKHQDGHNAYATDACEAITHQFVERLSHRRERAPLLPWLQEPYDKEGQGRNLRQPHEGTNPAIRTDIQSQKQSMPEREEIEYEHKAVAKTPAIRSDDMPEIKRRPEQHQDVERTDPQIVRKDRLGPAIVGDLSNIATLLQISNWAKKDRSYPHWRIK